ncbi:Protein of unknown function [Gryllus bimaculatus]|nr:Protein of unknown function [Gryllus bimaculatus]
MSAGPGPPRGRAPPLPPPPLPPTRHLPRRHRLAVLCPFRARAPAPPPPLGAFLAPLVLLGAVAPAWAGPGHRGGFGSPRSRARHGRPRRVCAPSPTLSSTRSTTWPPAPPPSAPPPRSHTPARALRVDRLDFPPRSLHELFRPDATLSLLLLRPPPPPPPPAAPNYLSLSYLTLSLLPYISISLLPSTLSPPLSSGQLTLWATSACRGALADRQCMLISGAMTLALEQLLIPEGMQYGIIERFIEGYSDDLFDAEIYIGYKFIIIFQLTRLDEAFVLLRDD